MRFVGKGFDLTGYLEDSYISVLERVTQCPECFAEDYKAKDCSNQIGVQTLVVTEKPTSLSRYNSFYNSGLLNNMNQAASDAKAFLKEVKFRNFKVTYTNSAYCQNNLVFGIPDKAVELIGSQHLTSCTCQNCDEQSTIHFPEPSF